MKLYEIIHLFSYKILWLAIKMWIYFLETFTDNNQNPEYFRRVLHIMEKRSTAVGHAMRRTFRGLQETREEHSPEW